MSLFDNALRLHFSFCQQLAQLIETFGRLANDFAHDWFADFENVTVGGCADSGGAAFASQERHFAEAIARMQCANANGGSIFRDRDVGAATQKHKHGIALGAFFDDALAPAEMIEPRMLQQSIELFVGETLKKRFAAQDLSRLFLIFASQIPGSA